MCQKLITHHSGVGLKLDPVDGNGGGLGNHHPPDGVCHGQVSVLQLEGHNFRCQVGDGHAGLVGVRHCSPLEENTFCKTQKADQHSQFLNSVRGHLNKDQAGDCDWRRGTQQSVIGWLTCEQRPPVARGETHLVKRRPPRKLPDMPQDLGWCPIESHQSSRLTSHWLPSLPNVLWRRKVHETMDPEIDSITWLDLATTWHHFH